VRADASERRRIRARTTRCRRAAALTRR
jgi:hypothetical protein